MPLDSEDHILFNEILQQLIRIANALEKKPLTDKEIMESLGKKYISEEK